jgi:hypothetical protein
MPITPGTVMQLNERQKARYDAGQKLFSEASDINQKAADQKTILDSIRQNHARIFPVLLRVDNIRCLIPVLSHCRFLFDICSFILCSSKSFITLLPYKLLIIAYLIFSFVKNI